jgi:hypothetical protein
MSLPQKAARLSVVHQILTARSPSELAPHYTFPMAAQIGGQIHIYATPKELAEGYATVQVARERKGQAATAFRIAAVELPRNNRFRVWVDWLYAGADGTPKTGDQSIYYLSRVNNRIAVEMIQCLSAPPAPTAPPAPATQGTRQPAMA